jgi:hypothetical protein
MKRLRFPAIEKAKLVGVRNAEGERWSSSLERVVRNGFDATEIAKEANGFGRQQQSCPTHSAKKTISDVVD